MVADAVGLLEDGDLFEVLEHDHPDFSLYVSFDDEVAAEYDEAIDRLTQAVAGLPDVARAIREDREVVLVGGTITASALQTWLSDWWRFELRPQEVASPDRRRKGR